MFVCALNELKACRRGGRTRSATVEIVVSELQGPDVKSSVSKLVLLVRGVVA